MFSHKPHPLVGAVVDNPDYWRRDKHQPSKVYCLLGDEYMLQPGEPVWMPEIGLGIGRGRGTYDGWTRDWLKVSTVRAS